jgi:hypothetical protein
MRLLDEDYTVVGEAKVPPLRQVVSGWVSQIVYGDATLADVEPRPFQFDHDGELLTDAEVDDDELRERVATRLASHDLYDGSTEVAE